MNWVTYIVVEEVGRLREKLLGEGKGSRNTCERDLHGEDRESYEKFMVDEEGQEEHVRKESCKEDIGDHMEGLLVNEEDPEEQMKIRAQ